MQALKSLNKYLLKYKSLLLSGVVFVIISNIFGLYTPILIRYAIDSVIQNLLFFPLFKGFDNTYLYIAIFKNLIIFFALMILLTTIIRGVFMFYMRQTLIVMSRYIEFDLKNDLYKKYQALTPAFYKRNNTGDLMARISEDVSRVRMYIGPAIMYSVNLLAIFVMVIFTMFKINAYLSFWVLLPLPILSYSIYKVSQTINKKSETIQKSLSLLTTKAQEAYSGIRIIQAFARTSVIKDDFEKTSDDYKSKSISLNKVDSYFQPLMLLLVGVSTLLAIFIGGNEMSRGRFTAGNIAEFVYYINMLTWPVASLGWAISLIQRADASQRRINEFLQHQPEIQDKKDAIEVNIFNHISFENVSLIYPDTGITALKNLSINIKSGEKIAIVGKTGSGKSTLAELLIRNYDPTEGIIKVDGKPLSDLKIKSWRSKIGYVIQDVFLFSDTITNNIRFGKENVSDEEVKKFAKYAQIDKDVINMAKGYDTIVGERGVMLSGGQKQRISIARALIGNPQLLVLDDCLSAVDTNTETQILAQLKAFFENKTVVFITHKIFIAKDFDRIIVLNDGEIVEQGNHQHLIEANGYYAQMYDLQNNESL
jgi:ATP-binding cassette subfamily B multidrug efflux pump